MVATWHDARLHHNLQADNAIWIRLAYIVLFFCFAFGFFSAFLSSLGWENILLVWNKQVILLGFLDRLARQEGNFFFFFIREHNHSLPLHIVGKQVDQALDYFRSSPHWIPLLHVKSTSQFQINFSVNFKLPTFSQHSGYRWSPWVVFRKLKGTDIYSTFIFVA